MDGITRADIHASREWADTARVVLYTIAMRQSQFTSADVDIEMMRDFPNVKTHEKRAMGAVVRWAAKNKYVVITDRVLNDPRPNCHSQCVRILQSLIYQGGEHGKAA